VSDECFYVRIQGGFITIIALYVDDLLIACNNIGILNEIKEGLSLEFEIKDMSHARMCLGFRISRNRSEQKLTMSQEKHALSVLSRLECRTQMGREHQWKSVLMWMKALNMPRMFLIVRLLAA
jgi:Reverse transcriptase (RNA-dependent DNA polymerase)